MYIESLPILVTWQLPDSPIMSGMVPGLRVCWLCGCLRPTYCAFPFLTQTRGSGSVTPPPHKSNPLRLSRQLNLNGPTGTMQPVIPGTISSRQLHLARCTYGRKVSYILLSLSHTKYFKLILSTGVTAAGSTSPGHEGSRHSCILFP